MNNDLPYRPNVCLLIVNKDKKLFLGQRYGFEDVWQFPQGGVDDGDTAASAALREAAEELGADKKHFKIIKQLEATHSYDFRNTPDYAVGKWRGQSQTFWLIEFNGTDGDIDLARYHQEFAAFCWCSAADVREQAEPVRLPGYLAPLEEFEVFLAVSG
jgi:putative (di)nucleoside polyphosphate hydrolase